MVRAIRLSPQELDKNRRSKAKRVIQRRSAKEGESVLICRTKEFLKNLEEVRGAQQTKLDFHHCLTCLVNARALISTGR